jgi:broad specificity phosphatase PhoE
MRPQQTVAEMAEDALSRQSSAHAQRTGQSLAKALEAVLKTPAGRQLEELGSGAHQHEEARDWQENLLWERTLERLEGMATSDTVRRFATERHYSWVEGYMEWLGGKETRTEYHAVLEEELASLRG